MVQAGGRDGCESCLSRAASTFGAGVRLHRPVHPGGTASVGSMDGRGARIWAGQGGRPRVSLLLRAASPAVVCGAEEQEDPRFLRGGRGASVPVALERVGAGNPAPICSGLPRIFLNPSGIRDAGTAAPSGPS